MDGEPPGDSATGERDADLQRSRRVGQDQKGEPVMGEEEIGSIVEHIGSSGYTMWKTAARSKGDDQGQTRAPRLDWGIHPILSSGLQARRGGNMLRSIGTYAAPRELVHPSQETGMIDVDEDRVRSVQSGQRSRGSPAPKGETGAPRAGRRTTGNVVQQQRSPEERDLMRDPWEERGPLRKLARTDPTKRFDTLYRFIYHPEILAVAAERVRQNTGGRTAGIDGQTRKQINSELLIHLAQELKQNQYHPQAVRRVSIPKGKTGRRAWGIPAIRDRMVQAAVAQV